jgi:predicted nucleic acid-binding protein
LKEVNYPKGNLKFSENQSVLFDANIFLKALYDDNGLGEICLSLMEELINSKTSIYVSSVVLSEVINRIIMFEFQTDMRYKINSETPFNTIKSIDKMVSVLNTYDKIKIDLDDKVTLKGNNLQTGFNKLNKDKRNRYLLKPYFDATMDIYNDFKERLNLNYLNISEETYSKALNNFQCQMMSINDAQHLQVALDNEIDYIVTTDKDFAFVAESLKTSILKIDKDSLIIEDAAIGKE